MTIQCGGTISSIDCFPVLIVPIKVLKWIKFLNLWKLPSNSMSGGKQAWSEFTLEYKLKYTLFTVQKKIEMSLLIEILNWVH